MSRGSTSETQLSADELARRLRGLETLLDVTGSLAAELDPRELLQTITRQACQALNCDRASLFQYDAAREELYTLVVTELEISEIRSPLGSGITGDIARRRVIANVADPQADARWNSSIDRATGYTTRNILAGPLVAPRDGSLLGVLQLLNKHAGTFDAFDEQLLMAFSQHAAIALERVRVLEELRRRDEVEISLNVARDIQRGFMPQQLPTIDGYEVATWWFPNQAVGGDYCDVFQLADGRIGMAIADVSGHGLGPSLIMASCRAGLRALALEHTSAEVLLGLLGRALADDLQEGRFITMVMVELDPLAHTVEFANAGHAPAMHFSAGTGQFTDLVATGLPLGVLDRPEYPQGPPISLGVGDLLILCTDGIVEAMNRDDEQFGLQRLEGIVRQMASAPVSEIVRTVGENVESHYLGDSPPDDLTILAARRNA